MDDERGGIGSRMIVHEAPRGLLARAIGRRRARRPVSAPLLVGGVALAAATLGFALGRWTGQDDAPPAPDVLVQAAPDLVPVRLVCPAAHARSAAVAASWNGWDPAAAPMVEVAPGLFATTVFLERGRHEYMFVVDGATWIPDVTAAALVDDGFGNRNAVIDV